jgi:uncharacterized protein YjbI with pentapeptide repeats
MKENFQSIISAFQNDSGLEIRNRTFSNEIIFDDRISRAILDRVNLSNCKFESVDLINNSFLDCTFENCEILGSEVTKVDFDETIFRNCQFQRANFGWSQFADCELLEIILDDINFEGTIISDLKTKNTTSLNLYFNERFPMNFWKSNRQIEITNSLSFEKFLKGYL